MEKERTLVLIKPDGVKRNLSGKIISRFEDTGLKIVGIKMVHADEDFARKHYPLDEKWAKGVYEKTKKVHEEKGIEMKHKDHLSLGKTIQQWCIDLISEGPVVAIVFQGPHSIELVRKIIGHTEPRQANPGTIRGDFTSIESYEVADKKQRVVRNLVHASDSKESAEKEIALWFDDDELVE